MHAVVCVKQVPDTTEVRIDPKTNTLRREGVPSIINPYDAHAVEEALRLKDQHGGKVTLISMGPPQAAATLRRAMSWGADRAILLTDRAFAGSDTLATSYILAEAIMRIHQEEPVDLVFCGKQAIDGDTAQVGPGIARRLGWLQLTYVMKIEWADFGKKEIQVERKLEGAREVVWCRLPAVLTAVKDLNEIRYASLPSLIRAARCQVEVWNQERLGLDSGRIGLKGSPTTVNKIFAPPQRGVGEIIPGGEENPREAAAALVDRLIAVEITADR